MNVECLPRLGFDPFSVDVSYILLEQRRVAQLAENVSEWNKALGVGLGAGRTGGML